ncbi:translation initiation factor IF-2-like [Pyrgilauda ruficollis]|uniref:translation initiation factor IF-2-like n=1 Tax=Pyrgilauda ruficollis TaxID=221976 RepID=UPI001B85D7AC|nr:translation initiation factor IF-2-like [Pyrgilauda ruficollis]
MTVPSASCKLTSRTWAGIGKMKLKRERRKVPATNPHELTCSAAASRHEALSLGISFEQCSPYPSAYPGVPADPLRSSHRPSTVEAPRAPHKPLYSATPCKTEQRRPARPPSFPTHLLLHRRVAPSPRDLGVPQMTSEPRVFTPFSSPPKKAQNESNCPGQQRSASFKPFPRVHPPRKGLRRNKKGEAAPRRAQAPPQPRCHRERERQGRQARSGGRSQRDVGKAAGPAVPGGVSDRHGGSAETPRPRAGAEGRRAPALWALFSGAPRLRAKKEREDGNREGKAGDEKR